MALVAISGIAYYSNQPSRAQGSISGGFRLLSTSVVITSLDQGGLNLSFNAVVYNPLAFGATLSAANYSVYANGRFVGNGHISQEYEILPQSAATLVFPYSIGWGSVVLTAGTYLMGLGHVNWMVNGTASIKVGGLPLSVPFDFATG